MKRLVIALFVLVFGFFLASPLYSQSVSAQADASSQLSCGTLKDVNPNDIGCTGSNSQINKVVQTVLQLLSIAAGIIAVIMIIISGLKYITSQGDSNAISSAKNSLIYAIIGIVIVVFAQVLVQFVLQTSDRDYSPNPVETEESPRDDDSRRFEPAVD